MMSQRDGLFFPLLCCALLAFAVGAIAENQQPNAYAQSPAKQSSASRPSSQPNAQHTQKKPQAKTFPSPQDAAAALYAAAEKNDEHEMLLIFGPNANDIIVWSQDPAERKADIDLFAQKYRQMHRLVKEPDSETTLYVGAENWPLPFPLVEQNGLWYFDADLGRKEILYRRIGENQWDTIDVLSAMVDAENEYFEQSGSTGAQQYASRLNSAPSSRDGLYWDENRSGSVSPIGSYVARAGYNRSDRKPLYGYYFRIITQQGPNARGGARNYMINGEMTGGFAFVAFPAEYRSSGVKTFIVNQDATIYEKDLGPMTGQIASTMVAYNPDSSWTKVR